MTDQDAEMIFKIILFAYEAVRMIAWAVIAAFTWLYDLTPATWPDTIRFGAIAAILGLAWGVIVVVRR